MTKELERFEIPAAAVRRFQEILGERRVVAEPAELAVFCAGESTVGMSRLPGLICRPDTVEEVRQVLLVANAFRIPTTAVSSGTIDFTTHPYPGGLVIDFSWMNRILKIDTESDYAVVEPGVTIGQLNKAIRPKGYWAPFGSYPPEICVLPNYCERGHTAIRTGGPYDDVLALEVVTPTGIVFRTGSAAFGDGETWHTSWGPFPDIRGLFMGAGGSFGVFTKGAVRIYPMLESQKMVVAGFHSIDDAIAYCVEVGRANLGDQNVIWHWSMYKMFDQMYGHRKLPSVSLVAVEPWERPPEGHYNLVTIQMTGYAEDVATRERICYRIAERCGGDPLPEERMRELYPGAWDHFHLIGVERWPCEEFGKGFLHFGAFAFVYAAPGKIAEIEKEWLRRFYERGLRFGLTYYSQTVDRARTQSIRFTPFIDPRDEEMARTAHAEIDAFYREVLAKYGAVPMLVTHAEMRDLLPETGGYYEVWKAIKRALDPNNIMNPHTLY